MSRRTIWFLLKPALLMRVGSNFFLGVFGDLDEGRSNKTVKWKYNHI